jgi:predicted enzyme related to lactoylglutathione lyase
MPSVTLTASVLGSPDPRGLARFYQRLLGWPLRDDPASVQGPAPSLRGVGGTEVLSHVPPVWPPEPGTQQMQQHLDLEVDDLAAAAVVAEQAGARLLNAYTEPHEDVRTYADPAGHPFCLFVRT